MEARDVQKLLRSKFKGYKFIVVSNREPYIHMYTPEGIRCKTPAGGLTAGLDPLMQTCKGTWIAGGSGDADRETVDENDRTLVPPEKPKYVLRRVWMTKEEVDLFYFGFSNQTLWPLCHNVFQKPVYREDFWNGYIRANKLYADAVLAELENVSKALIWFQDYHLALAPKLLRGLLKERLRYKKLLAEELGAGIVKKREFRAKKLLFAHFWHIPWPHWETLSFCPWGKELLEGLLANDLIGFHLKRYCVNFLAGAEKTLGAEVDYKKLTVRHNGRTILVKNLPLGIDFDIIDSEARKPEVEKEMRFVRSPTFIPYKYIGVGVDRVDYTKGILERFKAIERFLEKYPQYQNNFIFVEAGAPSRTRIPVYSDLHDKISVLAEEINWRYQRGRWKPIMYIEGKLDLPRLLALYRDADVCIISPLHDGMNLVAKEFIAGNIDCTGALVLSRFAGATEELKDAIIVNPNDREGFADAIHLALSMPEDERKKRMENLRKITKENNVYKWLADFITESSKLGK